MSKNRKHIPNPSNKETPVTDTKTTPQVENTAGLEPTTKQPLPLGPLGENEPISVNGVATTVGEYNAALAAEQAGQGESLLTSGAADAPADAQPIDLTPEPTKVPELTDVRAFGGKDLVAEAAAKEKPATELEEPATDAEAAARPVPEKTAADQTFDEYVANLAVNGNDVQKLVITGMTDYAKVMGPGKTVSLKDGVEAQQKLWSLLRQVLRNPEEYRSGVALLVLYFKNNRKTYLHPEFTFRFTEHLTMNKDHIGAFTVVVNMLYNTALSNSLSAALRQVDINRALPHSIFTELDRSRLAEFFQA